MVKLASPEKNAITPLPKDQTACMMFIQFCEGININVLFPFMAFMVEDFGYSGKRLGVYVGGLAASFCGAQFFSSFMWGKFSDRFGRKPAIISGTFGAAFGMLIFGTAKNYPQAVAGRLISGFLSGNLGVLKSYLTEFTDDSNRAVGFSLMSLSGAIGNILAPLAGGLLCNPAKNFPSIFSRHGIFGEFPYLLPCLLCVFFNVLSSVFCGIFMRETRRWDAPASKSAAGKSSKPKAASSRFKRSDDNDVAPGVEMTEIKSEVSAGAQSQQPEHSFAHRVREKLSDMLGNSSSADSHSSNPSKAIKYSRLDGDEIEAPSNSETSERDLEKNDRIKEAKTETEDDEEDDEEDKTTQEDDAEADEECIICSCASKRSSNGRFPSEDFSDNESDSAEIISSPSPKSTSVASLVTRTNRQDSKKSVHVLKRRVVLLATGQYGVLCMAFILLDETLPLFLKLKIDEGGFSFDSTKIGMLLSCTGMMMLLFTGFALPIVARESKAKLFRYGVYAALAHLGFWPLLGLLNSFLLDNLSPQQASYIIWPLLIIACFIKNVTATLAFTAVIIQVSHCVHDEDLGAVNGFGQSLASLARSVGPALGGALWSVSLSLNFVVLNFIVSGAVMLVNLVIADKLPLSLDFKKKRKGGSDHDGGGESSVPFE